VRPREEAAVREYAPQHLGIYMEYEQRVFKLIEAATPLVNSPFADRASQIFDSGLKSAQAVLQAEIVQANVVGVQQQLRDRIAGAKQAAEQQRAAEQQERYDRCHTIGLMLGTGSAFGRSTAGMKAAGDILNGC
jgi:hypothetical protein